jgi:hypothetical protein
MDSKISKQFFFALSMLTMATALMAQDQPNDDLCADFFDNNRGDDDRYCEVREETLSSRDLVDIDARSNGGVTVVAWDRNEILVRAMVTARSGSESDAEDLASEVELSFGSRIEADGPRTRRRENWSVSYYVFAPIETDLDLVSTNGGIHIEGIKGNIEFQVTNGGAYLGGVAGDVRGRTTNGGVHITLEGDTWDGEGLDVVTTNGGVRIYVPEDYNARLETGTVNGGIDIDFPITIQGRMNRRRLTTNLGSGGPTIRAITTNGGVRILQS